MKIYIRRLEGDKEIINKFRIPIGLFLNSITARIAASAVSGDFRKDILKYLESLKDIPELQDNCVSNESTELAQTSKDLILDEAHDIIPLSEIDNESLNDNYKTELSKSRSSKYTLNFPDGTTIERENSESKQEENFKVSYLGNEVSKSKDDLTKYKNKGKSFSLFAASEGELEPYIDKLNTQINSNDKAFNNALNKYRKNYKKQKRLEFNQIFKILKKSARQNKGLRLVDVQSNDGTIVIIEF